MAQTTYPESQKMLRIGYVGSGPFSFYGDYLRVINKTGHNPLNMRVTHIWGDDYSKNYAGTDEYVDKMVTMWNEGRQAPKKIAEKYNVPNVCTDYHEMVNEVDGVMIMDFDRAYDLAEPFLQKGMPVFLCSPVAVNVPMLEKIIALAEKTGSAIHSGSFTVAMPENMVFAKRIKKDRIRSFFAHTYCGFFTSYANDGLEPVHRMAGRGIKRVALFGWDGSNGYDPTGVPVSRIHLEYAPRDDNPAIQGILNLSGSQHSMEWYRFHFNDGSVQESRTHWTGTYDLEFQDFHLELQQVFATNQSIEPFEDMMDTLKVVIAAYKSANEGGSTIAIDEIGDYRMPTVRIEDWKKVPG